MPIYLFIDISFANIGDVADKRAPYVVMVIPDSTVIDHD